MPDRTKSSRPGAANAAEPLADRSAVFDGTMAGVTDTNPFSPFLRGNGHVVLDGGLATALEVRGHDLNDDLWSARVLLEDPEEIRAVHRSYLEAGADCVTTASYQASTPGLAAVGLDVRASERLLVRSSELAIGARDAFVAAQTNELDGAALKSPLVAASIGPYGAYLADGSEYVGQYGVGAETLDDFHRRRFGVLAESGVDLLACETIPNRVEAEVLLSILEDHPPVWAWFTFTCPDGEHISDGSSFEEVVEMCDAHERVAGVGVNCTAPALVPELMGRARTRTDLPLVAYPNSGEIYEPEGRRWRDRGSRTDAVERWLDRMMQVRREGAAILGGCCRIGPGHIAQLREALAHGD